MALWSRLRSLLGLGRSESTPSAADAADLGASPSPLDADAPSPNHTDPAAPDQAAEVEEEEEEEEAPAGALPGVIDDWTAATATGLITLADGAALCFGREACRKFTPLIGLRIEVLSIGLPPPDAASAPRRAGPALWATRLRLAPGSESEYAARLRISQVERAVRGQVERVINLSPDAAASPASAPPWARNKAGKLPAGPARPQDAFFALTVVLARELPQEPAALAALLRSPGWPRPAVRIIPLSRKGQPEAGFSAELTAGGQRAFLLYRPLPYASADTPPQGVGHVGLFVGGPHSPRALTQLPKGVATTPLPLSANGEPRLIAALARSLLQGESDALGLVVNRAGKAWKPREIALSQLGDPEQSSAAAIAAPLAPFMLFIDWNVGAREGARCQKSTGMEALGLPDVAVFFTADADQDRARDVLWFACHELAAERLPPEAQTLSVPRRLQLLPGSRLSSESPADVAVYRIKQRDELWLELELQEDAAAS